MVPFALSEVEVQFLGRLPQVNSDLSIGGNAAQAPQVAVWDYNAMLDPHIVTLMKSKESLGVQETPIPCKIVYRPIAESGGARGDNLAFSGGGIQFTGEAPLPMAQAAEVKIDAVKGVSPPLTAYIEVTRCEPGASGGYRLAGVIKGIRSG